MDAVSDATDSAQFLDVQVHELPGPVPLVPDRRLGRIEHLQPPQPEPPALQPHRRQRDARRPSDPGRRPPLPPQPLDLPAPVPRQPARAPVGPAASVLQPGFTLRLPELPPLVDRGRAHPDRGGHLRGGFPRLEPLDHLGSPRGVTFRRSPVPPAWKWELSFNHLQLTRRSPVNHPSLHN